jgi:hypothetical protein
MGFTRKNTALVCYTSPRMTRILLSICLILLLPHVCTAEDGPDEIKQVLSSIPKSSLGKRIFFINDTDRHYCTPLHIDSIFIGWVYSAQNINDRIFIQQCREIEGDVPFLSEGAVSGVVQRDLFELKNTDNGWVLEAPTVPGYGYFANASFCKYRVAYWAVKRTGEYLKKKRYYEIYSLVYDFSTGKNLKRDIEGVCTMSTDNRKYFPRPVWDSECLTVKFEFPSYAKNCK